jgi:hypothetical protein
LTDRTPARRFSPRSCYNINTKLLQTMLAKLLDTAVATGALTRLDHTQRATPCFNLCLIYRCNSHTGVCKSRGRPRRPSAGGAKPVRPGATRLAGFPCKAGGAAGVRRGERRAGGRHLARQGLTREPGAAGEAEPCLGQRGAVGAPDGGTRSRRANPRRSCESKSCGALSFVWARWCSFLETFSLILWPGELRTGLSELLLRSSFSILALLGGVSIESDTGSEGTPCLRAAYYI